MGWLRNKLRDNEDRLKLIQHHHELDRISAEFRTKTKGLMTRSDAYQGAISMYGAEASLTLAEIHEIETAQMLRRAMYWRVPIPSRPYAEGEETDFWVWNSTNGRYYMSDMALSIVRREAYHEWEMWTKPYLSFIAIGISLVSLGFSLLKT